MFSLVGGVGGTAVGLFGLVYGLFFWPADALLPSIAPVGSGMVVLVGTVWGAWLLRRTRGRRLISLRITLQGVRGVMEDGELVRADWSDSKFAIDMTSTSSPATSGPTRCSLRWVGSPAAYAREISLSGLSQLLESSRLQGLSVSETSTTTTGRLVTKSWHVRARHHAL